MTYPLESDEVLGNVATREVWNAEDTEIISKDLAKFKTCPTKNIIRELFDIWDDLREIVEREGFPRCYKKVKNIQKKRILKDG